MIATPHAITTYDDGYDFDLDPSLIKNLRTIYHEQREDPLKEDHTRRRIARRIICTLTLTCLTTLT